MLPGAPLSDTRLCTEYLFMELMLRADAGTAATTTRPSAARIGRTRLTIRVLLCAAVDAREVVGRRCPRRCPGTTNGYDPPGPPGFGYGVTTRRAFGRMANEAGV